MASTSSGTGTNLKVGGTRPEIFFGRAPPLFGSKSTISCFGERFRDGEYGLVSCLFVVLLLTVPSVPMQSFVKVGGGHVPPVPYGVCATVDVRRP